MSLLPDAPRVAASTLVEMLRRHYLPDGRPPGGIFAAEIESPDGMRRADALWCPWTIGGGTGLIGHEVKVSRSDVMAELADPMKADHWARYCSRWWLVVSHPSLVDGLAIPEAWGIMAPPSGRRTRTMTVVRQAPELKPADTGPGWRRVAAWQAFRIEEQVRDLQWKVGANAREAEDAKRQLVDREAAELGRTDHRAALVGRIVMELQSKGWDGRRQVPVEDIVAAIVDVDEHRNLARRLRQDIGYMASEARRLADPALRAAEDLAKLAKHAPETSPGGWGEVG